MDNLAKSKQTYKQINTFTLAERIVDHLLARAYLAAYRERPYQRWIALARIAAKLAERGRA